MPYVFNKITVRPQLPKRISKLYDISYNLWWSWNTEFLRLFKKIDMDLWEKCEKNPVKFLRLVSQDRLEEAASDQEFLKEYDKIVRNRKAEKKTEYTRTTLTARQHPEQE